MITKVARKKLKERRIMSWWVTIAVTVKVGGCAAEHGVLVRRRCRHWTPSFLERTGYHRCHTEWRGHHPVPDSTSLEQQ